MVFSSDGGRKIKSENESVTRTEVLTTASAWEAAGDRGSPSRMQQASYLTTLQCPNSAMHRAVIWGCGDVGGTRNNERGIQKKETLPFKWTLFALSRSRELQSKRTPPACPATQPQQFFDLIIAKLYTQNASQPTTDQRTWIAVRPTK